MNSNLQSFFIEDDNKTAYLGYVEPVSEQSSPNARILVFPVVSVKKGGVTIENISGINIENLSPLLKVFD